MNGFRLEALVTRSRIREREREQKKNFIDSFRDLSASLTITIYTFSNTWRSVPFADSIYEFHLAFDLIFHLGLNWYVLWLRVEAECRFHFDFHSITYSFISNTWNKYINNLYFNSIPFLVFFVLLLDTVLFPLRGCV